MPITFEPATTDLSSDKSIESMSTASISISRDKDRRGKNNIQFKVNKSNKQAAAVFVCKTIKDSLDDEMKALIEPYRTVELTSLIKSAFVDKSLSLHTSSKELEAFNFKKSNRFKSSVKSKIFVKGGSHNGYAILHIPAFIPVQDMNVPENATNFKLSAKLICISDFHYYNDLKGFVLKDEESHGLVGSFETTMLPVLRMQTQPITTQIHVDKRKPIESNVSSVVVLAVKYYSYQNGKFTHLTEGGAMKIVKVF